MELTLSGFMFGGLAHNKSSLSPRKHLARFLARSTTLDSPLLLLSGLMSF